MNDIDNDLSVLEDSAEAEINRLFVLFADRPDVLRRVMISYSKVIAGSGYSLGVAATGRIIARGGL